MSMDMKRLIALFGIKAVRWALYTWLLVTVFHHSHWTVAFSLALIFAQIELSALLTNLREL